MSPKPDLLPGCPYDLEELIRVALAALLAQRDEEHERHMDVFCGLARAPVPNSQPPLFVCDLVKMRAHAQRLKLVLEMWLGERPVADAPEVH